VSSTPREDGYDTTPTVPERTTTKIWGDGKASNGCPPLARLKGKTCTDADDKLKAGDSFILESVIPATNLRTKTGGFFTPLYDGGDRITANLPIAVTRAAFPSQPGSLMAGGVEVIDTDNWGLSFTCPVGPNYDTFTNAFEYTGVYIMASQDGTTVKLNGASPKVLNRGQSKWHVGPSLLSTQCFQSRGI